MKIGYKQLLDQAMSEIETLTVEEAVDLHVKDNVQFVDLRDIRELKQEGKIPGTYHMPRGMLEFWIDPESPYFKNVFSEENKFIFYCKSGWRSALATQTAQRMGLQSVCHIGGGFDAWKESGAEVEKID
jgi:rhodanese-related sulfurtransferase